MFCSKVLCSGVDLGTLFDSTSPEFGRSGDNLTNVKLRDGACFFVAVYCLVVCVCVCAVVCFFFGFFFVAV